MKKLKEEKCVHGIKRINGDYICRECHGLIVNDLRASFAALYVASENILCVSCDIRQIGSDIRRIAGKIIP